MAFQEPETQKVSLSVSSIITSLTFSNAVTSVWTAHKNSNVTRYDKNFKQTNKLALKTRATTARAQSAFRKTYSKHLPRFVKEIPSKPVYLPEEAHPYGRPNRPGTPVGDVVSNFYGENAEKMIT